MTSIHFDQVSLQFPGVAQPAVKGCTCTIESGQLVVILGPSGCGKTTLLKMVNRLYEPTSGSIYLDGKDIRQLKATTLRRQIGYVIQQSGLFPHMTVVQNIAVVPKLLGWQRSQIQQRTDELLSLVQLPAGEYRDRYPAQLSGGQQQRVALARALAGNPEVLLMDEPFGALDAITRVALQDEMLRMQRQLGKTILFVSHDVEEALKLGDRILILNQGEIVQYDTPLNCLMQPANGFVQELLGASNRLRQLSLMTVAMAMERVEGVGQDVSNQPTIEPQQSLREALGLLLERGVECLWVQEAGVIAGYLTLEQVREVGTGTVVQ